MRLHEAPGCGRGTPVGIRGALRIRLDNLAVVPFGVGGEELTVFVYIWCISGLSAFFWYASLLSKRRPSCIRHCLSRVCRRARRQCPPVVSVPSPSSPLPYPGRSFIFEIVPYMTRCSFHCTDEVTECQSAAQRPDWGGIFRLMWKRLPGSYFVLSSTRRS